VYGAFPRLSEAQIEALAAHGHRRPTHPGEVLFREGDPSCDFFVILAGKVAIVTGYGGDEHVISVHGPGRFLGELSLLTGQTVFVTAVIREPGEVLVVPVERLRHLVTLDPLLGGPDSSYLPTAPLPADRARNGLPDRRLPLPARHSPAARTRRPQPSASPVHRPRTGQGGRGSAPSAGRPSGGDAGGHLADHVLRNPTNAELAHCSVSGGPPQIPRRRT